MSSRVGSALWVAGSVEAGERRLSDVRETALSREAYFWRQFSEPRVVVEASKFGETAKEREQLAWASTAV